MSVSFGGDFHLARVYGHWHDDHVARRDDYSGKTAYGAPQIAYNTWLEIHGQNLVPADTPSSGVDWSNAPDFANGQMPTQLGPVSVSFGGGSPEPGYVYWYCSAATNPNCAEDQINVLAPLLGLGDLSQMRLTVNNNGVPIAVTAPFPRGLLAGVSYFRCDGAYRCGAPGWDPGRTCQPLSRTQHAGPSRGNNFFVRYRFWPV